MNYLSLFSGIGGLDLGLDRAGMNCVGQVELDEYCRRVLAQHWPEVPRHDDVRTAADWWGSTVRPAVHVVAGGPPCTPFSSAGRKRGVADERWGWPWMADVVRALRPRYVIVENVPDLVRDAEAFGWILGDLHVLGFDAEWSIVPACALGAPHPRERVFIVAYPAGCRLPAWRDVGEAAALLEYGRRDPEQGGSWSGESEPHGVAYGVPRGMDRRRALGNAVVPAVGEFVGRLVMAADAGVAA